MTVVPALVPGVAAYALPQAMVRFRLAPEWTAGLWVVSCAGAGNWGPNTWVMETEDEEPLQGS